MSEATKMTKPTPNFRRTLSAIQDKKIVVPVLRAMAADVQMEAFHVKVEGATKRPYDGWFHPSSQATWSARQLYYYLTAHEDIDEEELEISSLFAITQGHFWHEFIQHLLLSNGMLEQAEVPLVDEYHNVRGHMDGALSNGEGLEIKTMNDFTIKKIETWNDLKELKPEYYGQCQDYLAISDRPAMRFVIMGTGYPFNMVEVVVPRDDRHIARQRAKYREAIECAQEGVVPEVCRGCGVGSDLAKVCPVRRACPVGASR